MKKIYVLITALAAGLAGCNYLDNDPVGKVIVSTVSQYRALLTDGYAQYPVTTGRGYTSLLSDEIGILYTGAILDQGFIQSAPYTYTWQYGVNMLEFEWLQYYRCIFNCNAVIDGIEVAEQDSDESRWQILGEALALRAYCHFELANLYAKWYDPATSATDKAPPVSLEIDIDQDYYPSTVEKIYERVLTDIRDARKNLEIEKHEEINRKYRFSQDALTALESRVLLYIGDWDSALTAANSLIGKYELVDLESFDDDGSDDIYLPWKNTSPENIMALDRPFSYLSGDLVSSGVINEELLSKFSNDLRTSYMGYVYDISTFEVIGLGLSRSSSDRTSFRISEMYLTAAEASLRSADPDPATARRLLKELAAHRLTADGYAAKETQLDGMDSDRLLEEIADERMREFLMEGHRWYDLRRTTRPEIEKQYNNQRAVLNRNDSRYVIPFPLSAVNNNPHLAD